MPPSPMKPEKIEKPNGFKTLFKEDESEETENIDTKWILDILGEDKDSPERKSEDDVVSVDSKPESSKAHLKTLFSNSNFTSTQSGMGSKQVIMGTARKLDFGQPRLQSSSKKLNFVNENCKIECMDQRIPEKLYTPAPIKMIRKSLSDTTHNNTTYNKETIMQVSRRLQEELNDTSTCTMVRSKYLIL